jgi:hypothetical protein
VFDRDDAVACLLEEGIVPAVRPVRQFNCTLNGNVSYQDGGSDNFIVNIRSRPERGQTGFVVDNPNPDDSTLSFRQLNKDQLTAVQALFDELCSGVTLYGDTTVLDELDERPVNDFSMTFNGNISFADGGSEPFNVTKALGVSADLVPDNIGDEAFTQLLQDQTFQDALEAGLNAIT